MRALALHVVALFIPLVTCNIVAADEFRIFDDASQNAFEVTDGSETPSEIIVEPAPTKARENYPDPVVPEPEPLSTNDASATSSNAYPDAALHEPYWDGGVGEYATSCGDCGDCGDCGMLGSCSPGSGPVSGPGCSARRFGGLFVDSWIAGGFTYNSANPDDGFNTPQTFNDFSNEFQANQAYVSFGRAANRCGGCFNIGAQVDLLYGTDYFFTTADGLETRANGAPRWNSSDGDRVRNGFTFADYGLSMPQLFADVFIPLGSGLDIKVGHFLTPLGYESVRAPENFFYSHSYVFQYGNPITHTGVLLDWAIGSKFNLYGAYTRGWNNWEDLNDKPNWLAGFSWCPSKNASLAFGLSTGSEDLAGQNNRTVYSLVYTRRLGIMTYVFEHTFGTEARAAFDANFNPDAGKWYGINQYFFVDVTPRLTTGLRVEWFRDQDNTRILQLPFASSVSGGNYFGLTMGANWRPMCNLIVRPELRYDSSDVEPFGFGSTGVYNGFADEDQFTLAVDAIFRF